MIPGAIRELIGLAEIGLEAADELQFLGCDRGLDLLRGRTLLLEAFDDRVDLLLQRRQRAARARSHGDSKLADVLG